MNIACALRWRVASVGITLLGVAHPIRENISGVGYARRWTALIRGRKGKESRLVAFITPFVKFLEQTRFVMYFYVREL